MGTRDNFDSDAHTFSYIIRVEEGLCRTVKVVTPRGTFSMCLHREPPSPGHLEAKKIGPQLPFSHSARAPKNRGFLRENNVFPVPPCFDSSYTLFSCRTAYTMNENNPKTLMPLARVTSLFGFRDSQNFRLSIAPRIGIPILLVGRRWFARTADVYRAFGAISVTASRTSVNEE